MRFSLLVIALVFLHSCVNLEPKYCRPDMSLVESYRFAPEETLAYANLPWWKEFGDPVLDELIATALQNNQTLKAATATVSQFYAQYQIAFSQLFPQIGGQQLDERTSWDTHAPLASPVSWFYQLLMTLSYEIDFWGKIRNAVEAAEANFLSQVDTRLNVILSIVSGLAKAYVLMLQYDRQLEISKQTLASRQELFRIAKLRKEAGIVSLLDVKQAQAQVEDAEAQIKTFEGLIPIQEDLISVLLGAQPGPIPRGKLLEDLRIPPIIPAGLPSDLLENRPDIMVAEQNLISANAQIGQARAAFFPLFQLTGSKGKQSVQLDNLLKNISNFSQWQLDITQPLYTGGALTGALSEAEAVFLENYHIYQQTVLTAMQQVSDALIGWETAEQTFEIQLKEIDSYQVYLKLAKLRYYNGLNDYLTVEIAEQNLFAVQLSAAQTERSIFSYLIDLYTALGQGWDVEADYCDKCDNPYPLWKALFF